MSRLSLEEVMVEAKPKRRTEELPAEVINNRCSNDDEVHGSADDDNDDDDR